MVHVPSLKDSREGGVCLRFIDRRTGLVVPTVDEIEAARVAAERKAVDAEAEIARLKAELEALRRGGASKA